MSLLRVYPYKMGSASARDLARALTLRVNHPVYRLSPDSLRVASNRRIINWGSTRPPVFLDRIAPEHFLNPHANVAIAADKIKFLRAMSTPEEGVAEFTNYCLKWCTTLDDAINLLNSRRFAKVVVRTTTTGRGGAGIHIVSNEEELRNFPNAPLYTLHHRHRDEFRVHVFRDQVIDFQQKKRRQDFDGEVDTLVRSYENGWVFCREDVQLPAEVRRAALVAVATCGLDFGAVDVAYRAGDNHAVALEVNTAPGLSGQTLESYTRTFAQWYEDMR